MRGILARLFGCWGAFLVCWLLFPGSCTLWGVFWGGLVLTALYVAVRPIIQTLLLPLNLFLLGVFTPLTDALLVLWACAWTPGTGLGWWQALAAALAVSVFWLPYTHSWRREHMGVTGGVR